jgi:hypothetical protein
MTNEDIHKEVYRLMCRMFPNLNKKDLKNIVIGTDIERARETEAGILDIVFELKEEYDNEYT